MQDKLTIKRVLDTTRPNTSKPIFAVSGDYSVRKVHAIIAADGDPIMVPVTAAVVISAERPDGASDSFAGQANGDGSVTVPVAQWMIAVEGEVECSVSVTTAAGKISTTLFYINVQKSPHIGEVSEDDPEYDLLALVLANENVRQANEDNRVAAEAKREAAETAREDAELSRAESEDARNENESGRVSAEKSRETKFSGWERDIDSLPSFDARITRNAKEIANLKAGLPDDTFYEDSAVAHIKDVPANALPYAEVVEVGGTTRKCTNLIPFPYIGTNGEAFGTTYTINSDGTITFSGKTTSGFTVMLCEKTLSAGSYYLSDNCSATGVNFVAYDIDADAALSFEGTFTLTKSTKVRVYYLISVGFDGAATVYPMLNAGETALPYEPYFEGLRSANVESVESVGANLIPFPYADANSTVNGITYTVSDDGTLSASGTLTEAGSNFHFVRYLSLKAGTYTISGNFNIANMDLSVYDIDKQERIVLFRKPIGYISKTFALSADNDSIWIYVTSQKEDAGCAVSGSAKIMLNEGTTALPYRPYTRHTLPIPEAVQTLPDYGEGVDATYFNRINLDEQKYSRHAKRVVFDGTEDWRLRTGTSGNTNANYVSLTVGDYGEVVNRVIVCDRYEHYAISLSNTGLGITVVNSDGYNAAMITVRPWSGITDVTEWKTYLANQYAAGTPVTVVYGLAEAEVTDISDLLPADNLIPVEGGGTVRMVNEHGDDVPSTVVYQLENEVSA